LVIIYRKRKESGNLLQRTREKKGSEQHLGKKATDSGGGGKKLCYSCSEEGNRGLIFLDKKRGEKVQRNRHLPIEGCAVFPHRCPASRRGIRKVDTGGEIATHARNPSGWGEERGSEANCSSDKKRISDRKKKVDP